MGLFNLFTKTCLSGETINDPFVFSIDPKVPAPRSQDNPNEEFTEFNNKRYLCLEHFLKKLPEILQKNSYPFIFCEPLNKNSQVGRDTQNYYYKIEDLPNHYFSPEDQQDANSLLQLATVEKPIVWLPKDVIKVSTDRPLIKIKPPQYNPLILKS